MAHVHAYYIRMSDPAIVGVGGRNIDPLTYQVKVYAHNEQEATELANEAAIEEGRIERVRSVYRPRAI